MSTAITIRIPIKMKKELESLAKNEKQGMSDIIRESLDHYLILKKFRLLRNKTLPFAEAQGLLTDEDIFEKIS